MKKQCFVNFYSLWIKNRAEKDTFEAYGKSSKARKLQLREESSRAICMSPVPSESPGRCWKEVASWDRLLYGEYKNVGEDPEDHISSHSLQGPYSLLAGGHQEVEGQWTTVTALSCACWFGVSQQLYFWKQPQNWKTLCLWDPHFHLEYKKKSDRKLVTGHLGGHGQDWMELNMSPEGIVHKGRHGEHPTPGAETVPNPSLSRGEREKQLPKWRNLLTSLQNSQLAALPQLSTVRNRDWKTRTSTAGYEGSKGIAHLFSFCCGDFNGVSTVTLQFLTWGGRESRTHREREYWSGSIGSLWGLILRSVKQG